MFFFSIFSPLRSNQFKGPINKSQYSSLIFNQANRTTNQFTNETTSSLVNKSLANRSDSIDQLTEDELDEIEKRINFKLEHKRLESINQFNQADQLNKQANAMARDRLEIRHQAVVDNLEQQTDLDTEHSRQENSKQTDSEQSDANDDELEDDEEINNNEDDDSNDELNDKEQFYDNELDDKDYKHLRKRKIKNDYYIQTTPLAAKSAKFGCPTLTNLPNSAQAIASQQIKSSFANQTPVNSILPHYIPNHHLITNSAANSDKLSSSNDNNRLSKKAKELRKNELFKREYQRLDNQTYTMHSPSQNTSNHSNHLAPDRKSGCNL